MNRLFRNICENERLDTMEESEDEAEFENTEPDKYVTLSKEYIMTCRFNKRFCKWVPVEIATKKDVVTRQQVKQHEMRYLTWHNRMK
jgi:putative NADPH-quinone reductase